MNNFEQSLNIANLPISIPLSNESVTVPSNEVWKITVNIAFYNRGGDSRNSRMRIDGNLVAGGAMRANGGSNTGGTAAVNKSNLKFIVHGGQTISHDGDNGMMVSGFVIKEDFDENEDLRNELNT